MIPAGYSDVLSSDRSVTICRSHNQVLGKRFEMSRCLASGAGTNEKDSPYASSPATHSWRKGLLMGERSPSVLRDCVVDVALVGAGDRSNIPLAPSTWISQAQATHDRSRSCVDSHRFGEDSGQPHVFEAVSEQCGGTFRSQSLAPEVR